MFCSAASVTGNPRCYRSTAYVAVTESCFSKNELKQIPAQKKDTIAGRVGQARCSSRSSKVCQFQPAVMNDSFEQAVEDVKILKQRPGYGVLGEVYGLYKQATVGDVNIGRPGIFDLAGRGKWDAWERRKGLSKDEAMAAYVKLVEELKKEYGF
ncbi:hypothetical protein PFLUV_G00271340 [Perca fluviatilis]|uniref:ACB domain-containing protein n=1 Tax=Perca fluviatilis TaxID=8168 RepID=A0A6A5DM26_PERFL|nr:hypothetical protein PFLUV_G00271340 [Perca fluviatilis]